MTHRWPGAQSASTFARLLQQGVWCCIKQEKNGKEWYIKMVHNQLITGPGLVYFLCETGGDPVKFCFFNTDKDDYALGVKGRTWGWGLTRKNRF